MLIKVEREKFLLLKKIKKLSASNVSGSWEWLKGKFSTKSSTKGIFINRGVTLFQSSRIIIESRRESGGPPPPVGVMEDLLKVAG